MKDLKDLIKVNEANSEEIIKNTVWSTDSKGIKDPDIFIINIEDKIIEFATIEINDYICNAKPFMSCITIENVCNKN